MRKKRQPAQESPPKVWMKNSHTSEVRQVHATVEVLAPLKVQGWLQTEPPATTPAKPSPKPEKE